MIDSSTVPPQRPVFCSLLLLFLLGEVVLAIFFAPSLPRPPLQIGSVFPNTEAMVYLSLGHVSAVEGLRVITHCFL